MNILGHFLVCNNIKSLHCSCHDLSIIKCAAGNMNLIKVGGACYKQLLPNHIIPELLLAKSHSALILIKK